MVERAEAPAFSNPAAVGLAGFGGTTLLLQLNTLGICGAGAVLWMALFFGGLAQLVAGLQEFHTRNNFGYAVFTTYGAFWLVRGGIYLGQHFNILTITTSDIGWMLVPFTLLTAIFLIGALRQNGVVSFIFTTLLIGFILLDIGHITGLPAVDKTGAVVLIITALSAWYMMANIILTPLGVNVPVCKPWVKPPPRT